MAREDEQKLPVQREEYSPSRTEGFWESPFQMMRQMREEMDRLFEHFGFGSVLTPWERAGTIAERAWSPACDVWETDDDLKIRCELPGVEPNDIELYTTEDAIQIRAKLTHEEDEQAKGYHRKERRYGSFQRQFVLPATVKADQAKAAFRHGVLEVTLPKSEEAKEKMRKVPVEVSEEEISGSKSGKKTEK